MGASCAGSTYKQVADWRSVGELVIKKPPSRLHCLPSPRHLAEGNTVSVKVKYSLLLFHSHLFVEARTLLLQQPAVFVLYCGFLKRGSKLWCSVWLLVSRDFRYLAQLMENTGHVQKIIHPPKMVIIF